MPGTGYEDLSQLQLHSLFSTETWKNLGFENKINACQEVENRYAAENNVAPCNISHQQMDGASYGYQSGNTIYLNTSLVRDGEFITSYTGPDGKTVEAHVYRDAPGWNVLDTVYHEGTHGINEEKGLSPETYVAPDTDWDLYRIQGEEKAAYAAGNGRTLNALNEVEQANNKPDSERDGYFSSVNNESFQRALENAMDHYEDPDIENTLANVITDRDLGITRENQPDSYYEINMILDSQDMNNGLYDVQDDGLDDGLSNGLSDGLSGGLDDGLDDGSSDGLGNILSDGFDGGFDGGMDND